MFFDKILGGRCENKNLNDIYPEILSLGLNLNLIVT